MPIPKGPNCFGDVMKEFKAGVLSSGKGGPKVKDPKQAKAIASSMCHSEGGKKIIYGEMMAPLGYPQPNVSAKFLKEGKSPKPNGANQKRPNDSSSHYRDPYGDNSGGLATPPNLGTQLGLKFTDNDAYEGNLEIPGNNKMMPLQGLFKEVKCWDGYTKVGTKMKKGKRVNNCIKTSELKKRNHAEFCEELIDGIAFLVGRAHQIRGTSDFSDQGEMVMTRLKVMDARILQMMSALSHALEMGEVEIHPWMVDKITLAADYLSAVADNMVYGDGLEIEIEGPGGLEIETSIGDMQSNFKEKPNWDDKPGYKKGLSGKDVERARAASAKSQKAPRKSDKSLAMWPTDKEANKKRKESGKEAPKSPATKAYHNMFDSKEKKKSGSGKALKNKAEQSGIPLGILRQVYAKGVAAWKTGHRPGMTPQQWAMARVNSFITGSGGARKADASLWERAKKHKGKGKPKSADHIEKKGKAGAERFDQM